MSSLKHLTHSCPLFASCMANYFCPPPSKALSVGPGGKLHLNKDGSRPGIDLRLLRLVWISIDEFQNRASTTYISHLSSLLTIEFPKLRFTVHNKTSVMLFIDKIRHLFYNNNSIVTITIIILTLPATCGCLLALRWWKQIQQNSNHKLLLEDKGLGQLYFISEGSRVLKNMGWMLYAFSSAVPCFSKWWALSNPRWLQVHEKYKVPARLCRKTEK